MLISSIVTLVIFAIVLLIVWKICSIFLAPLVGGQIMQLVGLLFGLVFLVFVINTFLPMAGGGHLWGGTYSRLN